MLGEFLVSLPNWKIDYTVLDVKILAGHTLQQKPSSATDTNYLPVLTHNLRVFHLYIPLISLFFSFLLPIHAWSSRLGSNSYLLLLVRLNQCLFLSFLLPVHTCVKFSFFLQPLSFTPGQIESMFVSPTRSSLSHDKIPLTSAATASRNDCRVLLSIAHCPLLLYFHKCRLSVLYIVLYCYIYQ